MMPEGDVVDVHAHPDLVNVDWILRYEDAPSAHLITNRTTRKALASQLAGCWFRFPGESISPKSTKPVPRLILRKNSQSNRSDRSAATQAILMSVYRKPRLRGLNPTKTIADALKTYLATGQLPPLPDTDVANG